MRRVALKGLAYRKVRAALTALAVVLGVAMVSGTFILTDTISKAFDGIFADSYRNSSVVISGRQLVSESASGDATIDAGLVEEVRGSDGVADAAGAIFDINSAANTVKLLDADGEPIGGANSPKFGFGFDPEAEAFNPLSLVDGEWASGDGEVVVDKATAEDQGLELGSRIGVSAEEPAREFEITGIARFGSVDSLGGATMAVFDLATAQVLLGKQGRVDSIFVAADDGVSPQRLVTNLGPVVPPEAQVRTGAGQARADSSDTREATQFIQYFLLAFAVIALGVGAFVIFNTLAITVAQRTREFATLRSLGASRRQVMRSVLLEGLAIGIGASLLGLVLGVALAKGLNAVFDAMGLSLPQVGLVFELRTVIVSLALGIVVTVLASIVPARNATAVPPIAAVREGAIIPRSRLARSGIVPAVVLVAAVVLLAVGALGGLDEGPAMLFVGVGCLALVVGVGMIAPRVAVPLARFVGTPAARGGGAPGRLAVRNAMRNPSRTAVTAAALMIGLALVTLVATLASGLRNSNREALEESVSADYVLSSENGWEPVSADAGRALAGTEGVEFVTSVRDDRAKAFDKGVGVQGVDERFTEVYKLRWSEGSDATLAKLAGNRAVIQQGFAEEHDLAVGDSFELTTAAGKPVELTVAGVHEPLPIEKLDSLVAKVLIAQATFDAEFPRPRDIVSLVEVEGGAAPERTAALEQALAPFPDATVRTRGDWIGFRVDSINELLNLLYVLLALSVVISLFGMVNTLVLSVFERTRELGMLRAVGMTRRQVRRMVRHESVVTALIGGALGLPLGLVLAAAFSGALGDQGVAFSVPWGSLVVFTLVCVVAGILAAIVPARRAARLDVLRALQYE